MASFGKAREPDAAPLFDVADDIEFEAEDVITTSSCTGVDTSVGGWGNGGSLGGGEMECDLD